MRIVAIAVLFSMACKAEVAPGSPNLDMATGPDPCAGATCSGHGACLSTATTAVCDCDPGFASMGTLCVATSGACAGVTCSGHGMCNVVGSAPVCTCDPGYSLAQGNACVVPSPPSDAGVAPAGAGTSPSIAGCPILPANHIFNTPIASLPVDPNSAAYIATIGTHNLHLAVGAKDGIPYNVVSGNSISWSNAYYYSADPSLSWEPRSESDCASGNAHTVVSPCTAANAASPIFPVPATPLVEGGIVTDPTQPPGDHHILLVDTDSCRLWELYHSYPHNGTGPGWDIFGSATFDLQSNALRPDGWTSTDAAGFPILPLLLRADEASTGTISHALRFTISSSHIRTSHIWPARHDTSNGTSSTRLPPMGQLFRLKASYVIPPTFGTQSKAILKAMQTYGIYIADGGPDMDIVGVPDTRWDPNTFSEVQSVDSTQFEAVDISSILSNPRFDKNSGAVP